MDETVFRPPPVPDDVHRCPYCGGTGGNCDASLGVSSDGRGFYRPASPCATCRGSGLVTMRPYDPDVDRRS